MWIFKAATVSALFLGQTLALTDRVYIPPAYHNGSVSVEGLSVPGNLDGFKMRTAANRTSFDFWYFDAFSKTTGAAINIVFYNTGDFATNPIPLAVQVSGTYDNGTEFSAQALASKGVVLKNDEEGVSGDWKGAGASFKGTNLNKPNVSYEILLDSPSIGIKGSFVLKSVSGYSSLHILGRILTYFTQRAPAHYPCNLNVEGMNTLLLPHLHWANAVPDAQAIVDLDINGTKFSLTDGVGYHDKNWGDKSVITSPKYWDWGHAQLGPFSLVWYDLLDYNNTEHTYAYVAKHGDVALANCAKNAVKVRQWGANTTYPPTFGIAKAAGLTARFDLGGGQVLVANLTKESVVHDETVYARALGSVTGGIEGQQVYKGRGHYEEYIYGLLF
jgi:hypothetical protein